MSGFETVFFHKSQGSFVRANQFPLNRAAFFGDGIFETMVFVNNSIRFGEGHQKRAESGMKALKLEQQTVSTVLQIEQFLQKKFTGDAPLRVRWNIYRGGLGKYTPTESSSRENLLVEPFSPPMKVKKQAYISEVIHVCSSPWSHCKTLNGLTYVMANMERNEKGKDEVILMDDKGFISEAGSANLFWVKDGVFFTPSLAHNAIAGVAREAIINQLKACGITIISGSYTLKDMIGADQIFTSNVTGIAYIQQIDGKIFSIAPISLLEELFTI